MSKKTRKKSPKPSAGKATRARSATAAKTTSSKTRRPSAGKASKTASTRQTGNPVSKASKPSSKTSKLPNAAKPVQPIAAGSKAKAENPPPKKAGLSSASRPALTEGARAPSFSLPRDGGGTVSLGDYAGRKLVLFFYPRADTPGCTKEAIDFTRLASAFAGSETSILGISADPVKAQEAFRNKHELSIPLASDEKHEMLQAYSAWGEKSMYGRTFKGILRTTVLVGADGRILKVWRNVKVDGHADDVLAAALTA